MSTSDPHFSRLGEGSWEPGFLEGVAYRRRGTIPGETMVRLVRRTPRFSNTPVGSEPFGKFTTLFLLSKGYKSVDLIRSSCK